MAVSWTMQRYSSMIKRLGIISLGFIVTSCGVFQSDTSNNPKSCRERAAYHIASVYTSAEELGKALIIICPEEAP